MPPSKEAVQFVSNIALAARNKNKAACKACSKQRRRCDRGPETGSICSFCSKRNVECVRNKTVKGEEVSEGQLRIVEYVYEGKIDGLQSRDITSSSIETSHSVAAAMASPKPEDIINSPSSAMDSCFSPSATLFDSEDSKEDIASSSDSKSLIETLPEAEFQYCAADLTTEQDLLQRWIQGLIQAQPESSEGERPLISFLHAEFIHRVESVRDDRAVVWYSWRGIHYVALCQGFFDVLEGPFCFVSDDDLSLLLSVHPG